MLGFYIGVQSTAPPVQRGPHRLKGDNLAPPDCIDAIGINSGYMGSHAAIIIIIGQEE